MRLSLLLPLVALAGLAAGCADNPVTPEEHFEVRGVTLVRADSTVATVDSNRVTGRVALDSVGATVRYDVRFILEDGTIAGPADAHDEHGETLYGLDVRVADSSVARVTLLDEHDWEVTLGAERVGATILTIHLLHGGHDDFVSLPIPVVVEP
jgi:hypothetical protein